MATFTPRASTPVPIEQEMSRHGNNYRKKKNMQDLRLFPTFLGLALLSLNDMLFHSCISYVNYHLP